MWLLHFDKDHLSQHWWGYKHRDASIQKLEHYEIDYCCHALHVCSPFTTGDEWWMRHGRLPQHFKNILIFATTTTKDCHLTLQHASVCRLWDGVDVGGHLVPLLASVHLDDVLRIDGQVLVGVYDDAEETRVCLREWDKSKMSFQVHTREGQCVVPKTLGKCLSSLLNSS